MTFIAGSKMRVAKFPWAEFHLSANVVKTPERTQHRDATLSAAMCVLGSDRGHVTSVLARVGAPPRFDIMSRHACASRWS